MNTNFVSGFVALIGRPNVGKSTLMNRLVGDKIAIMSEKAQTTRNKIQGILTTDQSQIIFVDTPGIHKPQNGLDDYMDQAAYSALPEVDAVLFMTGATDKLGPGDQFILEQLQQKVRKIPVFLVLNKIDLIHPDDLATQVDQFKTLYPFTGIIPLSATQGNNIETLISTLEHVLPEGPKYYPDDQLSDHPEYFIVAELIREQILTLTQHEIPHVVAVIVEDMSRFERGKRLIEASIFVERESQKGIIIGKQASMLKNIGIRSRREIEGLLGDKVNLKLQVKVKRKWRSDPLFLSRAGYSIKDVRS